MLPGMGEMNESHDSPSRIAKGLSDTMRDALRTALDYGRHAATGVAGKTNTLAALVTRGLITPGRVHYLTDLGRRVAYAAGVDVMLLGDLHAEALAEDAERTAAAEGEQFLAELREDVRKNGPTPRWEDGIPTPKPRAPRLTTWAHLDDRSRHILTGVEVVNITPEVGRAYFEVRTPRWLGGRKLMETVFRGNRDSAPDWAEKVAVPDALYRLNGDHEYALRIDAQRTARRNRVQRVHVGDGRVIEEVKKLIPGGWTPEHSAELAAEARNRILTMDVRPGSLAEAAAIVDGVVKTAQLAALQRLAAIIDQRESGIPGERIPADEVRHMLRNIAHQFRIEWP